MLQRNIIGKQLARQPRYYLRIYKTILINHLFFISIWFLSILFWNIFFLSLFAQNNFEITIDKILKVLLYTNLYAQLCYVDWFYRHWIFIEDNNSKNNNLFQFTKKPLIKLIKYTKFFLIYRRITVVFVKLYYWISMLYFVILVVCARIEVV